MTARHPRCLHRPRRRSAQGVYYVNRIAAINLNFLCDPLIKNCNFWEIDLAKEKGAVCLTCVLYTVGRSFNSQGFEDKNLGSSPSCLDSR